MNALQWREEFSVGIAEVDHEHRELIELISVLQKDLQTDCNSRQILRSLGEIYAQLALHFAAEEKMMRATRYPLYADHKEDHEILLDELRDILALVEDDGVLDQAQLTDDLDRWFSDHFKTHDVKLHCSGYAHE